MFLPEFLMKLSEVSVWDERLCGSKTNELRSMCVKAHRPFFLFYEKCGMKGGIKVSLKYFWKCAKIN